METFIAEGGNVAPQATPVFDATKPSSNVLDLDGPPMSEDCLFLNAFTPSVNDGAKRPIMVFLHGGGWVSGAGAR